MDKIVWWNINTGGAKRLTDRLTAVFDRLTTCGAAVIGLSEAGQVVQPAIREFARSNGYTTIARGGLSARKGVSLLVHDSLKTSDVSVGDELRSDNKIVGQWVGMVVEGLCAEPVLVASVYNYCHHGAGLADSVAAAAHRLSNGAVIAGGDWNFSRTCDGTPEGAGCGTPAFQRLERELGWVNVLPVDQAGLSREMPSWPTHAGRSIPRLPRQLDQVFADAETARRLSVSVDGNNFRHHGKYLSDHAILAASIIPDGLTPSRGASPGR